MKHLKAFNENNIPSYSADQIKEIAKKYVDFNILNDLIYLCTEHNDNGKETSITVSLEGNYSYTVYNSDTGWMSYEDNIKYSIRDVLSQFINSGKYFTAVRYAICVFYKYSVNLISNRNEQEATVVVNDIVSKINNKYKNLRIGKLQSGFMGNDVEPCVYVEVYKDL